MDFLQRSKVKHPNSLLFAFQIFLLVLIIIGILLIATRNAWVPNVVEYLLRGDIKYQDMLANKGELLPTRVEPTVN